jgi:hypothetical protein
MSIPQGALLYAPINTKAHMTLKWLVCTTTWETPLHISKLTERRDSSDSSKHADSLRNCSTRSQTWLTSRTRTCFLYRLGTCWTTQGVSIFVTLEACAGWHAERERVFAIVFLKNTSRQFPWLLTCAEMCWLSYACRTWIWANNTTALMPWRRYK